MTESYSSMGAPGFVAAPGNGFCQDSEKEQEGAKACVLTPLVLLRIAGRMCLLSANTIEPRRYLGKIAVPAGLTRGFLEKEPRTLCARKAPFQQTHRQRFLRPSVPDRLGVILETKKTANSNPFSREPTNKPSKPAKKDAFCGKIGAGYAGPCLSR
jgi:hypothetical protein